MYFTKDTNGFRAFFTALQSNGNLRTGLVAGDFTVTTVEPTLTGTTAPVVSEVGVVPGLYTFLVPAAFLGIYGVGDYGILVQIDTFAGPSGAPNVRTAFAHNMKVNEKDFDDIPDAAAISNIQSALTSIENKIDVIDVNVEAIFDSMLSAEYVVMGGSGLTANSIPTDSTFPDDTYNGQLAIIISAIGSNPVVLARTISDYAADGTFTLSPDLPFTPGDGDRFLVVSRTATASIDNNAVAQAVWTIATTPTTAGSYGELVNVIGANASLIPALI